MTKDDHAAPAPLQDPLVGGNLPEQGAAPAGGAGAVRSAAQVAAQPAEQTLEAALTALQKLGNGIQKFTSTGLFFMIVGATFLAFAYSTIGQTHAGLTFVFVVLGIAILLYGTGTQSTGSFESADKATEVKAKIALAGRAGALAFAVSAGIVYKADDIRTAFREEKRYLQVKFVAEETAQSSLNDYVAEMSFDGVDVPVFRDGRKYIIALIPYELGALPRDKKTPFLKPLDATFIQTGTDGPDFLKKRVEQQFKIDLLARRYGGLDFDEYSEPPLEVSLVEAQIAAGIPESAGEASSAPQVVISPE